MPAERRTFLDPLESFIYWDASFAIGYFDDTHRFHAECLDFRNRMDREGTISVSSVFTRNELAFHMIRSALDDEARRTGQRWQDVRQQRPDIVTATMPKVLANRAELNRLTLPLALTDAAEDRAFDLMRDYALLPTDAYHIAIALNEGVTALATLDADFLRVDGIIVYTCLP